jgi:hypothetical protein
VTAEPTMDARFRAAVDMIGRTGATSFQIRYSDDEQPTVWMAVAEYQRGEGTYFDAAAGMDPLRAVLRLCELMIDGGFCTHCHKPTGFTEDFDPMPLEEAVCWYQFDPELKTFRRGCE